MSKCTDHAFFVTRKALEMLGIHATKEAIIDAIMGLKGERVLTTEENEILIGLNELHRLGFTKPLLEEMEMRYPDEIQIIRGADHMN